MFTLGIFGEYLARMYGRTMERPAYVVLEDCQRSKPERRVDACTDACTVATRLR